MSYSIETLQDFVLNLLNDPAAMAEYAADPTAVLGAAGLADLSPADIQEVLPLVADSLPVDGLPVDGLPVDGLPLDSLPLDSLPLDSLPLDSLPLNGLPVDGLPVDGLPLDSLPLDSLPLDSLPLDSLPLDSLPLDGLPGVPEMPESPLGDVVGHVDLDTDNLSVLGSLYSSNPENSDAPTVSGVVESALGEVHAGGKLDPEEFGGSLAGTSDLGDLGAGLVGHSNGALGAWGGADTPLGELAGGLLVDPEDGVALAAKSPLGDLSLGSENGLDIDPANPADMLDAEQLGDVGDAVAGTVASHVNTGADMLSGHVASGADTLGGLLTGPAAPVGDAVQTGADAVAGGIQQGGDLASEQLVNLPAADSMPALPELPDTGALPALPEVPGLDDLPVGDLPSLPVDLPAGLPTGLPDTSAVTDILSNNPVTDAVNASPVGGLAETATSQLSSVTDLTDDLNLGL